MMKGFSKSLLFHFFLVHNVRRQNFFFIVPNPKTVFFHFSHHKIDHFDVFGGYTFLDSKLKMNQKGYV
jgi:hypothetical protein